METKTYEQRQEEKRQRYLDRADKAREESARRSKAVSTMAGIMNGTPILIGHHSEKRHRRDIERMDRDMRKSVEEGKKAKHYEQKAASVGTGGISSDDPEAVIKLKEKLAKMERDREAAKLVNKQYRKGGFDAVEGLTPEAREQLSKTMALCPWEKAPYPPYYFQNLGANIRRVKERIKTLSQAAEMPEREDIKGEGYTIREDKEENRICFEFNAKPPREVCQMMRSHGFRWNRRLVAWTRHLNNPGRHAAEMAAKNYEEMG